MMVAFLLTKTSISRKHGTLRRIFSGERGDSAISNAISFPWASEFLCEINVPRYTNALENGSFHCVRAGKTASLNFIVGHLYAKLIVFFKRSQFETSHRDAESGLERKLLSSASSQIRFAPRLRRPPDWLPALQSVFM